MIFLSLVIAAPIALVLTNSLFNIFQNLTKVYLISNLNYLIFIACLSIVLILFLIIYWFIERYLTKKFVIFKQIED